MTYSNTHAIFIATIFEESLMSFLQAKMPELQYHGSESRPRNPTEIDLLNKCSMCHCRYMHIQYLALADGAWAITSYSGTMYLIPDGKEASTMAPLTFRLARSLAAATHLRTGWSLHNIIE